MKVALFITCFNDTLFPETGRAVVTLLERLGCEVDFPLEQTCCGQMHVNSGYERDAEGLLGRFARVFGAYEAVVSPSASCVAHVREHIPSVSDRVFELTEFLVDRLGVVDVGASFPHRVTLHPTCHSLRLLQIGDRPKRLLSAVRGIDLVDLDGERECCGFGGTFAIKNADTSMAMLSDKVRHVLDTRAEVCTSADTSCLMHIGGALSRAADGRARDAPGRDPGGAGMSFQSAAQVSLADSQLRRNIGKATTLIREKRERAVAELPDWEALRDAGEAIKASTMARLPELLEQLEERVVAAGGVVHWARDGAEANAIVASIARANHADEVIKVKSLLTDEIELNEALGARGHPRAGDRPRGADRPARPRRQASRTSWCPRSTAIARRSARCSSARSRRGSRWATRRRRSPRRRGCTCARSS